MIAAGIFRQYDIRGIVGRDLTADAARAMGQGFATLLAERGITRRDRGRPRQPAERRRAARRAGRRASRPAAWMSWTWASCPRRCSTGRCTTSRSSAGIQITGSHNPPEYNGFKLCLGTDSLHGEAIQPLRETDRARRRSRARARAASGPVAVIDRYVDDVVARIGPLARRLRVVFDCGNGAGRWSRGASSAAWASMRRTCSARATARFPNHHPDPTVVENLQDLIAAVRARGADLGIAFDGDADRIGVVDAHGEIDLGRPRPDPLRARCAGAHRRGAAHHLRREVLTGASRGDRRRPAGSRSCGRPGTRSSRRR